MGPVCIFGHVYMHLAWSPDECSNVNVDPIHAFGQNVYEHTHICILHEQRKREKDDHGDRRVIALFLQLQLMSSDIPIQHAEYVYCKHLGYTYVTQFPLLMLFYKSHRWTVQQSILFFLFAYVSIIHTWTWLWVFIIEPLKTIRVFLEPNNAKSTHTIRKHI